VSEELVEKAAKEIGPLSTAGKRREVITRLISQVKEETARSLITAGLGGLLIEKSFDELKEKVDNIDDRTQRIEEGQRTIMNLIMRALLGMVESVVVEKTGGSQERRSLFPVP